jgi:rhamnopyranosyl-N-acetylglucosaminyl-diphospho-decaprenol beta-1,3/1,4-galactofuranosyltransferase
MSNNSCTAVVLTYNRLHCLKECIAAIKAQTRRPESIIVVDNGSEADTGDWLRQQEGLHIVTIHPNIGPAAGMKKGLKEAFEKGFQFIWCMDDDGLPDPKALQVLMETRPELVGIKNSIVLDIKNPKDIVFKIQGVGDTLDSIKEPYVDGDINPWNGTLIHRDVIAAMGYPKEELFLWGEETEYYHRVKRSGRFGLISVRDSHHFHPKNAAQFYKSDWDVNKNWRAYYFIRNRFAILRSKNGSWFRAFLEYMIFFAGMLFYIFVHQKKQKFTKLKLLFIAAWDGVRSNYKKPNSEIIRMVSGL